jgi:hypothetical protein
MAEPRQPPDLCVAIPARNEEALIGRCLAALADQHQAGRFAVLVLANNCTDRTVAVAQAFAALPVTVIERTLPQARANAGEARHQAMALAARRAPLVLTTDADCVPDPDWIAAHRAAFAAGADAVCGRVSGDWAQLQRQPARALQIGALEWAYLGLLARAEALFDPVPHDPWPRHAQCCGANIGITAAMLHKVGGVPRVAVGEDRALIAAVAWHDGRVRHAPGPHVVASARHEGRAAGGMADALKARLAQDYRCDDQFGPAVWHIQRWRTRATMRRQWQAAVPGGQRFGGQGFGGQGFGGQGFGRQWAAWVASQPPPARLTPADLPAQIAILRAAIAHHDTRAGTPANGRG